jgi:hypothetical protein
MRRLSVISNWGDFEARRPAFWEAPGMRRVEDASDLL